MIERLYGKIILQTFLSEALAPPLVLFNTGIIKIMKPRLEEILNNLQSVRRLK